MNIFSLKKVLHFPVHEIVLSTYVEHGEKGFLALVTSGREIVLYLKYRSQEKPILGAIPWFSYPSKVVKALCFDPTATWLLLSVQDGCLYIVPALNLMGQPGNGDEQWSVTDVTTISPDKPMGTPTSLTWWSPQHQEARAIVGTEEGNVIFVELGSAVEIGRTSISEGVSSLEVYTDNNQDWINLLITANGKVHWRLVLEHRSEAYCWPFHEEQHGNAAPPSRSRLQGIKQLSVEKLSILRQKITETKRGLMKSASSDDSQSCSSEENSKYRIKPSRLVAFANTQLRSQDRIGSRVMASYCCDSNILTVHSMELEAVPQYVFQLPSRCLSTVLTRTLIFALTADPPHLNVIMSNSALAHTIQPGCEMNPDALLEDFSLPCGSRIMNQFKQGVFVPKLPEVDLSKLQCTATNSTGSGDVLVGQSKQQTAAACSVELDASLLENKIILDGCIIVTSEDVFICSMRIPPELRFLQLGMDPLTAPKADKLGKALGLNCAALYELAADIKLCERDFPRALQLYGLGKVQHIKTMLKFGIGGCIPELDRYLAVLLRSPALNLPANQKREATTLALMVRTFLALTQPLLKKESALKALRDYACKNIWLSADLTIDTLSSVCLWNILENVAVTQGLHVEVLESLLNSAESKPTQLSPLWHLYEDSLYESISSARLQSALVHKPDVGLRHVQWLQTRYASLNEAVIKRLARFYDPTSSFLAVTLPGLSNKKDSSVLSAEDIVEMFLLLLLTICYGNQNQSFKLELVRPLYKSSQEVTKEKNIVMKEHCLLSCGYSHAGYITKKQLFIWGMLPKASLGVGLNGEQPRAPHRVEFFSSCQLEVLSVSCGKQHTLALTTSGLFSWGGNNFGQLGLGHRYLACHPQLVPNSQNIEIACIAAGQFHSAAITCTGKLMTWGWGVYGQLGLDTIEDLCVPTFVPLQNHVAVKVTAGYAHTCVLTRKGKVLAFGNNNFGQLGQGDTNKSKVAVVVELLEVIGDIASGYFHTLALTQAGRVYVWGSHPQSLRFGSQKKHQQQIEQKMKDDFKNMAQKALNDCEGKTCTVNKQRLGCCVTGGQASPEEKPVPGTAPQPQEEKGGNAIDEGMSQLAAMESDEHLSPQLLMIDELESSVSEIACGGGHSCIITSAGDMYTWGRNWDGQLGRGGRKEAINPMLLSFNGMLKRVACGADFTIAVDDRGLLYGWGHNDVAQLGIIIEASENTNRVLSLRSNRRVLMLKQSAGASKETPTQLPPFMEACSKKIANLNAFKPPELYSMDEQGYGIKVLCTALEVLKPYYVWDNLVPKFSALKAEQALGVGYAVMERWVESCWHHMKASSDCSTTVQVLNYYIDIINDKLALTALLNQSLSLWSDCEFPFDVLEACIESHLEKLLHPLAELLFCGTDNPAVSRLSTRFCLHLSKSVGESGDGEMQADLLSRILHGSSVASESAKWNKRFKCPESEAVVRLSGAELLDLKEARSKGDVYLFSCAHHFSEEDFLYKVLPAFEQKLLTFGAPITIDMVIGDYHLNRVFDYPCPDCLFKGLHK